MDKFKIDTFKKIKEKDNEIQNIRVKLNDYNEQLKLLQEIVFVKREGNEISVVEDSEEYSNMSIAELEKTIEEN